MFDNIFASYNRTNTENETEDFDAFFDSKPEQLTIIPAEESVEKVVTSKKPITPDTKKKAKILAGSAQFEKAYKEALKINPSISKYKNFLVKTAKRESGFNSTIQNQAGAPYYGYFQMGENEIKTTTGLSVQQFRNDPVAQILGACKLYEMNLNTIKKIGVYNLGRNKGYSDDALVSGAWMGGPGGVKKYLLGQGDPSDSHWYKKAGQKGGSSVGKIMNNWKANE